MTVKLNTLSTSRHAQYKLEELHDYVSITGMQLKAVSHLAMSPSVLHNQGTGRFLKSVKYKELSFINDDGHVGHQISSSHLFQAAACISKCKTQQKRPKKET